MTQFQGNVSINEVTPVLGVWYFFASVVHAGKVLNDIDSTTQHSLKSIKKPNETDSVIYFNSSATKNNSINSNIISISIIILS